MQRLDWNWNFLALSTEKRRAGEENQIETSACVFILLLLLGASYTSFAMHLAIEKSHGKAAANQFWGFCDAAAVSKVVYPANRRLEAPVIPQETLNKCCTRAENCPESEIGRETWETWPT